MSVTLYVPCDSAALAAGADEVVDALNKAAAARGVAIDIQRNSSRGMFWLEPLVEVVTATATVVINLAQGNDTPVAKDDSVSTTLEDTALHITQSYAPETTLAQAAEVLGRAVADQPPGVFVDFRSADDVADRPAVTYREVRAGRVIRWSVVLDRSTRISIGCQSAPGHEDTVRAVCDQAVRSAHEVGTASRG